MAYIRQLPSGKWQAQIRHRGTLISHSARTKAAVAHWAKTVEVAIAAGTYSAPIKSERSAQGMTLGDAIKRYQEEVLEPKGEAVRRRSRAALALCRWDNGSLAKIPLQQVTKKVIVDFVLKRVKQTKSDTVKKDLNVLSKTISRAIHVWNIKLPYHAVREAREALKTTEDLEPGVKRDRRLIRNQRTGLDEELLLLAVPVRRQESRVKDIMIFALETAMRRGEIANLCHDDVNPDSTIVNIRHSKTDKATGRNGRRFPLSAKALEIVSRQPRRTLKNGEPDARVFGVAPDSITNGFKRLCARAGIEGLRFHDLRHEATSRLIERGYTFAEVMVITGHTAADMVARYSHLVPENIADKFAREINPTGR